MNTVQESALKADSEKHPSLRQQGIKLGSAQSSHWAVLPYFIGCMMDPWQTLQKAVPDSALLGCSNPTLHFTSQVQTSFPFCYATNHKTAIQIYNMTKCVYVNTQGFVWKFFMCYYIKKIVHKSSGVNSTSWQTFLPYPLPGLLTVFLFLFYCRDRPPTSHSSQSFPFRAI